MDWVVFHRKDGLSLAYDIHLIFNKIMTIEHFGHV